MKFVSRHSNREFWQRVAETDEQFRESFTHLPVYALSAWPGVVRINGWTHSGGQRSLVFSGSLRGEDLVTIHVDDDRDPREFCGALARQHKALQHRQVAEYRPVDAQAAVPDDLMSVDIDQAPMVFEVWEQPGVWWAAGRHGGQAIVIESTRSLAGTASLTRVTDAEKLLEAQHAYIRIAREKATKGEGPLPPV